MAGFYTIEKRDGCSWFITPDGAPFWSIGMNHIDSAAFMTHTLDADGDNSTSSF